MVTFHYAMQNFSAIRPVVRRTLKKNSWRAASNPGWFAYQSMRLGERSALGPTNLTIFLLCQKLEEKHEFDPI